MATQISTNVELVLFNNLTRPGTILLPSTNTIPGRILTFKNTTGALGTSTITFSTIAGQTFEDNTTRQIYNDPLGVYSFMAGQDNRWYTIGGVRMNSANISTITATTLNVQNIISSANVIASTFQIDDTVTPSVNTIFLNSTILYYQTQSRGAVQASDELFVWGGTRAPEQQIIPAIFSFDPRLIPNLVLWLDANDPSTFSFSSGTSIRIWFDKSGRAFDFSQDILANQPTFSASGFGNRGSVVFNATTTVLSSTSPLASLFGGTDTPISIFVVVRFIDHTNPLVQAIFNIYTGTGTNGWHAIYVDNNSAPNQWRYGRRDITTASVYANSAYTISSLTNYVHSHIFQRTIVNGFINGLQDPAITNFSFDVGDLTYTTSVASLGAQIRSVTQYYLNGEIGEILVYNGQVLGNQRVQVEQYLSSKWNIPLGPFGINGLTFWLDASQLTGLTNGQSISSWKDLSPYGYVGTAINGPTYTTNSQNGLPGITFNGTSQYINFGNILNMGTQPLYVFVVCKINSGTEVAIIGKSSSVSSVGRWTILRTGGNMDFFLDLNTQNSLRASYPDSSTATRVLTAYWDRNTLYEFENGYPNAFISYSDSSSLSTAFSLFVGAYQDAAGTGLNTPPRYLNGVIYEIMVYQSAMTIQQRLQIQNYLFTKWGITPNPFTPTSISGLHLWLDATESSSFVFDGSTVRTWSDKSSSNNSATQLTLANQPSYDSSQPAVVFNGTSSVMTINAPTMLRNRTGATVFAVRQFNTLTSDRIIFAVATGTGAARTIVGQANGQYRTGGRRLDADSFRFNIRSSTTNRTIESFVQDWANANWQIYEQGGLVTSSWSVTTTAGNSQDTSSTGIFLGTAVGGASQWFSGSLNELLVWPSALSNTQRQQMEGFLSWKWGFTLQSPISPLIIPGIQLWLDGADAGTLYSDSAGTTNATVGQTIGFWRDKSGAGRDYTNATSTQRPSYSSASNIVFANTQALSNAVTWNPTASWDIFVVARPYTIAQQGTWRTLLRGLNTDHPILIENASTRLGYYNNSVGGFNQFGTLTLDGNSTAIIYVSISATRTYSAALNGTLTLTPATPAGNSDVNMFYSLGNSGPGGNQHWGTVNEIFIVPNTNNVQRRLLEGYLAWKWGLQGNLPSDHPFKNNPPLHPFLNTPP